jgi:XTP/dITP diphosphohydrolase
MRLFYATTNPGKVMEVRKIFAAQEITVCAPADLGLALDVAETGATLAENATLKARAYRDQLEGDWIVLGDDTGLEIDALGGEPGIRVRRWDGSPRMTDEAIINYCLRRMAGIPPEKRGAQFRTVFALAITGRDTIAHFDGTLRGVILEEPDPLRMAGFPFESVFYVPEWSMLLGKAHDLPPEQKAGFLTHRDRALRAALPEIRAWLGKSL